MEYSKAVMRTGWTTVRPREGQKMTQRKEEDKKDKIIRQNQGEEEDKNKKHQDTKGQ